MPGGSALSSLAMKNEDEEQPVHEEPVPAEELDYDEEDEDDGYEEDIEVGTEVHNNCRCAECCRHLLIEVGLDDAESEPKIRERGSPIYTPAELTDTGQEELEGYLLNSQINDNACAFLEQTTNLCSIYETRPWICRVFDCDGDGKEQLIQLGIRPSGERAR
jgi:Fe-S-cluster containining protein